MSLCCLRMHLSLHSLKNKVEASITLHHSALRLTPLLPHTTPQMSCCIASPCSSPLGAPSAGPHVTVSRLLAGCPGWGHQAHQHLPGGPEGRPRAIRAGSGRASCGGWTEVECVPRRKPDEGAEALPWLEHMLSPVILEPVGHLWMEPPRKKQALSLCAM